MKKLSLLPLIIISLFTFGQAPQGINYQAIVRNSTGTVLANTTVSIKFQIHDGTPTGTVVFQEVHSTQTNQFGLATLVIGSIGNLTSVNWGNNQSKYLQVEMDPTGGSNYTDMGTTQLVSVPYALYAQTSGNGIGPTGVTGATGATGNNGTNGVTGATGATGNNGTNGVTGATGATGNNGTNGSTGAAGATGNNGTNGVTGATGATGNNGTNGSTGATGATGNNGTNGVTGATGVTGNNGTNGSTGATGVTGNNGTNGVTGATGATGNNGTNGVTGTTGATGNNGINGATGATGATGNNGTNGVTGVTGSNANLIAGPGITISGDTINLMTNTSIDSPNFIPRGRVLIGSSQLWVCPANVYQIKVELWGGGGGGAGGAQSIIYYNPGYACQASANGGNGGNGGYNMAVFSVTPGQSYSVVIGAGGSAGAFASCQVNNYVTPCSATGTNGSSGGGSTFAAQLTATGGNAGIPGTASSTPSNPCGSSSSNGSNGATGTVSNYNYYTPTPPIGASYIPTSWYPVSPAIPGCCAGGGTGGKWSPWIPPAAGDPGYCVISY